MGGFDQRQRARERRRARWQITEELENKFKIEILPLLSGPSALREQPSYRYGEGARLSSSRKPKNPEQLKGGDHGDKHRAR